MKRFPFSFSLIHLFCTVHAETLPEADQQREKALQQAAKSVVQAVPKAAGDPTRPLYHFRPPAQWMNDPNGTIFHEGYYHVFYQHNPYGDEWGHMHWGHARSRDLVYWEHLPIALWPSLDLGEEHCFSGCAKVNGNGEPMLFYTSVFSKDAKRPNEQWAAVGSEDFLTWRKHPNNPILETREGVPDFGAPWRDPFIFEAENRIFMVLGGELNGEAVIPVFEAEDPGLAKWEYRGILFRKPKSTVKFFECPNFFPLGERWLLIYSPYRPLEYHLGDFEVESLRFEPAISGILDYGKGGTFYASNVLSDDRDRRLLFGWVRGFKENQGWNGCLALPRVLSLDKQGRLIQQPAPELATLRADPVQHGTIVLQDEAFVLPDAHGDCLEIHLELEAEKGVRSGLRVRRSHDGSRGIPISYNGEEMQVHDTVFPYRKRDAESTIALHIFLDKSVLEAFVDGGRATACRVIYPPEEDLGIEIFSEGGRTTIHSIDIWRIKEIWPKE